MPLLQLQAAIVDLADGRVSPMFKPRERPNRHPGKRQTDAFLMAMAARAMSELMEGGASEAAAALKVARALGGKASTIKNWRDRLNQGPGPGAPQAAVDHYRAPLPSWPGSTGTQRGERLLALMKERLPPL